MIFVDEPSAALHYGCSRRHFHRIAEENNLTIMRFRKNAVTSGGSKRQRPRRIMYLFSEVDMLKRKKQEAAQPYLSVRTLDD
jgi:hypothetical protein